MAFCQKLMISIVQPIAFTVGIYIEMICLVQVLALMTVNMTPCNAL
jgi:hypothetical protein